MERTLVLSRTQDPKFRVLDLLFTYPSGLYEWLYFSMTDTLICKVDMLFQLIQTVVLQIISCLCVFIFSPGFIPKSN